MYSLEALRDIRSLEGFLGIRPGESVCLDHRGAYTSLREDYEARRTTPREVTGEITGYVELDLRTGELTHHNLPKLEPLVIGTLTINTQTGEANYHSAPKK